MVLEEQEPFKELLSENERRNIAELINEQHAGFVPVIIEKAGSEKYLEHLSITRYLFYPYMTMAEIYMIIRRNLKLSPNLAFFLLAKNGIMVSASRTVLEVFSQNRDRDGFLYLTYASQDVFGHENRL